jgi:hypothetical protein
MKISVLRALDQKVTRSEIEIACSLGLQSGNRLGRVDQCEFEVWGLELLGALTQHRTRRGRSLLMGFLSVSRSRCGSPEGESKAAEFGCTQYRSISHRNVLPFCEYDDFLPFS